jgi:hypothetical protein
MKAFDSRDWQTHRIYLRPCGERVREQPDAYEILLLSYGDDPTGFEWRAGDLRFESEDREQRNGPPRPVSWLALGDGSRRYRQAVVEMPIQGCALIALFSTAWEALQRQAVLFLLRPESLGSKESEERGNERLRALAARCGFGYQETHSPPAPGLGGPLLEEYRRIDDSRWRVGHAGPRHLDALRSVFMKSFEHEISPELWRWKYAGGRGCGTVVWSGERIVAHYGVISREIRFMGRDARGWLVGDVMVEPRERGALTRRGPFFLASASCSDACLAFDPDHLLGVGFPNSRHMRLAERTDVYREVGRVRELSWDLGQSSPQPHCSLRRLAGDAPSGRRRAVDRLWRQMDKNLRDAIVVTRDWAYLERRYFCHPENDYRVLLVRRRFLPVVLGVLVLNCRASECELLDVVAPLSRIPLLIEVAKNEASRLGATRLKGWIAAGFRQAFASTGCTDAELDVSLPTSVWAPGPDVEEIRDKWWLTLGDTDFH